MYSLGLSDYICQSHLDYCRHIFGANTAVLVEVYTCPLPINSSVTTKKLRKMEI